MKRLGEDELGYIFDKIPNPNDRKSFSKVCKEFLKIACSRLQRLHISSTDLLSYILPESPNLRGFICSKELSNIHMKLLAQSCPKLTYINLRLEQNLGCQADPDFSDDALCALANACTNLSKLILNKRLHFGDVGVSSLVRLSKNLQHLDLSGCVSVTDESLKAIGESNCLTYLFLRGCLITDLGLEYLANGDVKNCLNVLYLRARDGISDIGIFHLKQIVRLRFLVVENCRGYITSSGIESLESRSPSPIKCIH
ncbi:Leucine-rich repeat, cysteine-containing subtype [Artemisia annua]|uniref:Leucine-rich repeat, cysteine-containing subtype n=1 Tax=Artemisia annua TaxID=35608 RepID=A0A2U1LXI4_ARTAN|nr:Leucine-rich repeat, cysteine-containing subtype [Artemisia annua]